MLSFIFCLSSLPCSISIFPFLCASFLDVFVVLVPVKMLPLLHLNQPISILFKFELKYLFSIINISISFSFQLKYIDLIYNVSKYKFYIYLIDFLNSSSIINTQIFYKIKIKIAKIEANKIHQTFSKFYQFLFAKLKRRLRK